MWNDLCLFALKKYGVYLKKWFIKEREEKKHRQKIIMCLEYVSKNLFNLVEYI